MVGDIVTFKDCQNDKEKVVVKIWQINQEGNALVFIDDSEVLDEIAIDDEIVGIPITPEILEKNGFNIEIAPYTPDWMRCILNPNFFLEDRLKGFYHFNGNNLAKIQYVHELQHALKLCGIEKQIEL
jgi:hypothetical protein